MYKTSPLPWWFQPDRDHDYGSIMASHGTSGRSVFENVRRDHAEPIIAAVNSYDALTECRDVLNELIEALPSAELMRAEGKEEGPLLIRARKALSKAQAPHIDPAGTVSA